MVFLFRLTAQPGHRLLGWCALAGDRRDCVVLCDGDAPTRYDIPGRLWPAIELELSQSLPTRPLPDTSALHRAFAGTTGSDDYAVEYVACVPTDALPDLYAAVEWLDRSLA